MLSQESEKEKNNRMFCKSANHEVTEDPWTLTLSKRSIIIHLNSKNQNTDRIILAKGHLLTFFLQDILTQSKHIIKRSFTASQDTHLLIPTR